MAKEMRSDYSHSVLEGPYKVFDNSSVWMQFCQHRGISGTIGRFHPWPYCIATSALL